MRHAFAPRAGGTQHPFFGRVQDPPVHGEHRVDFCPYGTPSKSGKDEIRAHMAAWDSYSY